MCLCANYISILEHKTCYAARGHSHSRSNATELTTPDANGLAKTAFWVYDLLFKGLGFTDAVDRKALNSSHLHEQCINFIQESGGPEQGTEGASKETAEEQKVCIPSSHQR